MSERDGMYGTAASDGGAPERVREHALAAQRLAEAARRLAPADGTAAQRAAWQDAQVASIMAAEALDALPGDADLARAMADEAQSMAIEALKASQAAAQAQPDAAQPAEPPAPAQPPVEHPAAQEPPAQPAAQEPPAASGPASHTAWREAVPAFVPEAPAAQPGPAPEPEAAQPAAAPEPSPAPAAQGAQAAGAASPSAAPAKRSHKLRNACIALACALLVMAGLLAGAWLGLFRLPDPVQERLYLLPDPHAQAGTLNASASGASPGGFQLVLNQLCAMGEGSLDCPIEFENPESNQYSARISLEVDGQEVARSGMVAPGAYLSTVRLDGALEPGDHEARAVVRVYSGATQALTLSNSVTVRVG